MATNHARLYYLATQLNISRSVLTCATPNYWYILNIDIRYYYNLLAYAAESYTVYGPGP